MGLRLSAGRFPERNYRTDADEAILINETFVAEMNWQQPLGKQVFIDEKALTVIGVVEDFHYQTFILTALLTIASRVYKAASTNPADVLRDA